ncbi:hypothetical protein [Polaribacter butkevichii]|uniref:Uncharacterized protein n=1 Tax=Polaribacter butkevichii TaxID=218490 RepID=A0A2P6CEG0_9FLAO|nr:hypothetical protein [Polaribacter butkevichii]PQJ73287.1 hypothetical protein BTO14_08440 [Polaribacter butkevichii]
MKKKIVLFLLLVSCIQVSFSQKVRVIDNKGTVKNVNNNQVYTAATDPNLPTVIALENDVWINTSTTPNTTSIYNGTAWVALSNEHIGATGSVFFAGTDGKPAEENDELFYDIGNKRFGVGKNDPDYKLDVDGAIGAQGILNSNGTSNEPSYRFKNDVNTGLYRPAADEIGFIVGAIEAMRVEEDSNETLVTIKQTLKLDGQVLDESNTAGTVGQVLTATATGTNWDNISSLETTSTITNTIVGHKIADYTNENGGTPVTINETVTSLSQDNTPTTTNAAATGEITFTDENGATTGKAQVVSANAANTISVGTDGGAYLGPTVYTGFFIIAAPGGTATSSTPLIINGLPFKPSQITFIAHANVESTNIDAIGSSSNNINNSFGTMNGFARVINGTKTQQVIYLGGSGESINNISRYASSSNCIGLRYGNQDALDLGKITASFTTFTTDGFELQTTHTQGTSGSTALRNAIFSESLVVLYTAYK